MTAKTRSDILKIGWYQIVGGATGVLIILYSLLFDTTQSSGLNIIVYVFMLAFFTYSIFCGILCLQSNNTALRNSLINQFLQLIGFAFFGFAFSYVSGVYLSIGFDLSTSIDFKFNFGISKFDFNLNREHERIEFNFNLVAFGFIYWIEKLIKKIKAQKKISQLNQ